MFEHFKRRSVNFKRIARIYEWNMQDLKKAYESQGSKRPETYTDYLHAKTMYHEYTILALRYEKVIDPRLHFQKSKLIKQHQEHIKAIYTNLQVKENKRRNKLWFDID